MQEVPASSCVKVLGTDIQGHQGHEEFRRVAQAGWKSNFSTRPLWLGTGRIQNKLQALHLVVFPALSWCALTVRWTRLDYVRQVRPMQVQIDRRIAGRWTDADED